MDEEPNLCFFEDAWPVRFYLQRRAKDQAEAQRVDSTPNLAATSDNPTDFPHSVVTMMTHDEILTAHSECPVHPQPDLSQVSKAMKNFFTVHGMQELLIPLASKGIMTEKQFNLLRSSTPEQAENLVARTDHAAGATLNLLQRMMLKVLLRSCAGAQSHSDRLDTQ